MLISESDGSNLSLCLDDFVDSTTFVDDTLNDSVMSDNSPIKKINNLSLPEPKVTLSEGSQSDSKANSEEESESAKSSDEINEPTKTDVKRCSSSPIIRTFKRRNENIYTKN